MHKCLFINYHSIIDSKHNCFIDPVYSIDQSLFRQHLELLKQNNYKSITLEDIDQNFEEKETVCLTFDDGWESDFDIVYPILQEFGFVGSFFIPIFQIEDKPNRWAQYKEMSENGHYIGSHGFTHKYMSKLSEREQHNELKNSKLFIENLIGKKVEYFALPGGRYNKKTIQISQKLGYKGLLTTKFGFYSFENTPFLIPRWTIKKRTSISKFKKIVDGNLMNIKIESIKSDIKKKCQNIIPSQISDLILYKLWK